MIEKRNYKVLAWGLFFCILFGVIYFQFSLIVPPDGSSYYWYTSILNGTTPFSEWKVTRGPSFPILLFVATKLFGQNPTGVLIGFFILYIIFLITSFLLLRKVLKKYHKNNNIIYYILYLIFIMFNPLTIGYSHTLLTEAVAPAIIMLTNLLAFKWKDINWKENKVLSIIYTFVFAFISVFMWFLKQPYMPIILFIVGIASILIGIIHKSWKKFLEKFITIIIILITLIISIVLWNKILNDNGISTDSKNGNGYFLSNGLIQGLNKYYTPVEKKEYCSIDYINNSLLTKKEKDKIISMSNDKNWCDHIKVYSVTSADNIVLYQKSIIYEGEFPSSMDSINYLISNFIKRPHYILASYFHNYMTVIDLEKSYQTEYGYKPSGEIVFDYSHENLNLGFNVYNKNIVKAWWQYYGWGKEVLEWEDVKYMKAQNFEGYENHNETLGDFFLDIAPLYQIIFKILFLLALPFAFYGFIKFLKYKNDIYYIIVILFGSSFLHIFMHAVLGALIDRYAFPVFPSVILGSIFLLIPKKEIIEKQHKNNHTNLKYLVAVINKTENSNDFINKTAKENIDLITDNFYIKEDLKNIIKLDFKDEISREEKINIFIRYAKENNYNALLLIDNNEEYKNLNVKDLIKKYEETDSNILVFRRIFKNNLYLAKSQIYRILLKAISGQSIKDFESDIQIIDESAINYLSKISINNSNLIVEELLSDLKIEEDTLTLKNIAKQKNSFIKNLNILIYYIFRDKIER